MAIALPPRPWRIMRDPGNESESFIPMSTSPRSVAVLERAIEEYESGGMAALAARHLISEGFEVVLIEGDEDPDDE